MTSINPKRIKRFRTEYDFKKEFDIVLAAPFGPEEKGNTKYEFYDSIRIMAEKSFGKIVFLPHKELNLELPQRIMWSEMEGQYLSWLPANNYNIIQEIVIPSSELVLAYLGLPSIAAGMMIQQAISYTIPIIYFWDRGRGFSNCLTQGNPSQVGVLEFEDEKQAISHLESLLRSFYKIE